MKLFDGRNDGTLDGFLVSEENCSNNGYIIRNFDGSNDRISDVLITWFERWMVYWFVQKMVQMIVVLLEILIA